MKDRKRWSNKYRVHNLQIRPIRMRDFLAMKEFTGRPISALLDEAQAIYMANFMASSDYLEWCDQIEMGIEDMRDRRDFDTWDIGDFHDI